MQKVLIAGGTGFIGLSLAKHLIDKGFHPVLMARNRPEGVKYEFVKWDAVNIGDWVNTLNGAAAIVNLTGKSVDCIKTPDNCDVILRSRVDSTRVIGKALKTIAQPPKVWVQMSTAHIYGDPPSQMCTERSSTGYGLAPFVATAWEDALLESLPPGMREVRLRTSFVIGKNGGAMVKLKKIAKLGLGGRVGHGKQGISWIHEHDMNEIIYQSIINESYKGVYIASAPHPVSNAEFMREIRRKIGMPIGLPAPAWLTAIGARLLFNTDPELAIYGRYVKPERLLIEGFQFKYSKLAEAMEVVLR